MNSFQQSDKVPHGAMQINVRPPGGPALGGQFAVGGGQQATMAPPVPQMHQQQAQISSPSMPKGAQPVALAGAMPGPQLGGSAPAVPQRLAPQGVQAQQPFFRPQVMPGPQQQVPQLGQSQFQPQQFVPQPQPQPQFQPQAAAPAPAPAPALGDGGYEVRRIMVEGVAPNGQKLEALLDTEFPRGTRLLGAREVAVQ